MTRRKPLTNRTKLAYGTVIIDPADGETLMVLFVEDHAGYTSVRSVVLGSDPSDVGDISSYSLLFMTDRPYEVME